MAKAFQPVRLENIVGAVSHRTYYLEHHLLMIRTIISNRTGRKFFTF